MRQHIAINLAKITKQKKNAKKRGGGIIRPQHNIYAPFISTDKSL